MTSTQFSQDHRIQFLFPIALASLLVLGAVRFCLDNLKSNQFQLLWQSGFSQSRFLRVPINVSADEIIEDGCNVFEGKWVWDNVSYPLYTEESCPYLVKQVTCQRNGRPDSFYQSWRWQPNGCKLPRYGSPDNVREYNVTTAYRLALETWANWIESSINPKRQKVFFVTMSPTHLWDWEWKAGSDGNCFNETHPIEGPYWGTGSNLEIMGIVKEVTEKLQVSIRLLNITQLSEYRKDAHTSIFGERKGKLLTKEQRSDPKNFADCIHWCLPGVPDTWNKIFYAILLQDYRKH
nr:protein trichome birefringence-like 31 [Ipomoea batatas]